MSNSWDRQADETAEWYDRFALYLYMGSNRTVAAAHTFATRFAKGAAHGQLGGWRRAAQRHQWKARAAAFDAEQGRKAMANLAPQAMQMERKSDESQTGEVATGEERLRMVAELLRQVYGVLRQADLLTLTREEARQLLPTLRLFFRDLLHFYQTEATRLAAEQEADGAGLHADDFKQFMQEMGGLQLVVADLLQVAGATTCEESWRPLRDVLAQLYPDEPSARRIAAQAHLDSARIHFSARAVDGWHAILTEAAHAGRVEAVIVAAQQEYASNVALAQAVQHFRQARLPTETDATQSGGRKRVRARRKA